VRAFIAIVLVLLLAGGGAALWIRAEGEAPSLTTAESLLVGRAGAPLEIALADPRSGLRSLTVELVDGDGTQVLLQEEYPGSLLSGGPRVEHAASLPLDPKSLGKLTDQAKLRVSARDWSWRQWLSGNVAERELPLVVDVDPPRLSVATGLSYGQRGGSGAVAYRLSEPTTADGVRVGERFYAGYPKPGGGDGERVAIFALPFGVTTPPQVVARDAAGNETAASWPLVVKEVSQPIASVTLTRSFFDNVLPRLAGGATPDPAASFDDVNTRIRAENEKRIRELLAESSSQPLFDGALQQLANSQVTSRFAEQRTYFVDGAAVSKAVHYGYDLASTSAAPITAAAAGRVVYADDLGIYGNCVLVDHGMGVGTLYGHLSSFDVKAGDAVTQGQTLGRSGATGLAGGDHLHFAVLVGDTYVDPVEWWDAKWVETHIRDRWQAQPESSSANGG
jgi:murein DD-endopeptidase MepM/ murein hydrolase activator NlpD